MTEQSARFVAQFHQDYACWIINGEFVTGTEWHERFDAWLATRPAPAGSTKEDGS